MAETRRLRKDWGALAGALLGLFTARPGAAADPPRLSRLVAVEIRTVAAGGEHAGVAYVRLGGTVRGVIDPADAVVGLGALPKTPQGLYEYVSEFEIIAPADGQPANEVVYVDAENRGTPISRGALGGFLERHATSYARVQWQTGISAGVPAGAQGVGLVIMRDFARWLAGRTPQVRLSGGPAPAPYGKLILGGISQSAWFLNTFVAEGFNVDPADGTRVFDAAIAIDGTGNWLAINGIARDRGLAVQTPYVAENGVPLSRGQMLKRPATDPLFVDVANYSDFYRLRAGLTATRHSSARFRRYDWPAPHAAGAAIDPARCNGGRRIILSDIRYAPYFRAVVLGVERAIGVRAAASARALPPSTGFVMGAAPPASDGFNALPGLKVRTPKVDAEGWPLGGVRYPEAHYPRGRPVPPALFPVTTRSIRDTCGNYTGYQPFDAATLQAKGRSGEAHREEVLSWVKRLESQGFLLAEDIDGVVEAALGRPHT
jgi:hypothetical protein